MATGAAWAAMVDAVRNQGRPGIASSAIAAVDIALWDLKAKLLGVSVADAIGSFRREVPDLREWRIHQLVDRRARGAARGLGRTGDRER